MTNAQKEDFKKELRELLEKYNATINWTCDDASDLACVFDSHLEVYETTDMHEKPLLVFGHSYINANEIAKSLTNVS